MTGRWVETRERRNERCVRMQLTYCVRLSVSFCSPLLVYDRMFTKSLRHIFFFVPKAHFQNNILVICVLDIETKKII